MNPLVRHPKNVQPIHSKIGGRGKAISCRPSIGRSQGLTHETGRAALLSIGAGVTKVVSK